MSENIHNKYRIPKHLSQVTNQMHIEQDGFSEALFKETFCAEAIVSHPGGSVVLTHLKSELSKD